MNANAIQPGIEYAYTPYPSRNRTYYAGAGRVRAMHVYKLERLWSLSSSRKVTLVECILLDVATGEPVTDNYGKPKPIITVEARKIVATWDEHVIERERHVTAQHEEQERRQKADEERRRAVEAANAERFLKEQKVKNYVADSLGVPEHSVSVGFSQISISRRYVEEVLGRDDNGTETVNERTNSELTNQSPS